MRNRIKDVENERGLTLIELMVAIFIFSLITVSIVAVFVSATSAHQKARAIKLVKESAEQALNSIAKDVRMGKIENADASCTSTGINDKKKCVMISRSRGGKACYRISGDNLSLETSDSVPETSCAGATGYEKIIDLSAEGMSFDSTSGFFSQATDDETPGVNRGWAEMNFNIKTTTAGQENETDEMKVQTTISARDYGWEEVP